MLSTKGQKKLDRIEEIREEIISLEEELEDILVGPKEEEDAPVARPKKYKKHKKLKVLPAGDPGGESTISRRGREVDYDLPGVKNAIRSGMKPKAVAEKFGVSPALVYSTKSNMKRDGELDGVEATPQQEEEPEPSSPAQKRPPLTKDQFDEVKKLFAELGTSSAVSARTGYDQEEINIAAQATKYGMYVFNRKRQ